MDRLMIIGGSGLLGGHIAKLAKKEFEVIATYNSHPFGIAECKSIQMDITDCDKTEKAIKREKPVGIILSAAQRNVDFCEKNQKEVWKINVEGVKNVAIASEKVQAKLIYISTDLVFDGTNECYKEEDETNPVNHYGKTKLQGEREVANILDDYAIARVSVLYDWNLFDHTFNFVAWVYNNLRVGKQLELFTDQFRNATYIKNASDALISILKEDERGIFHVAGKDCVNRYYMGKRIADIFDFDEGLISICTSDDSNWLAKRPKRCCLSTEKMENKLDVKSLSFEEGLVEMKVELESSNM